MECSWIQGRPRRDYLPCDSSCTLSEKNVRNFWERLDEALPPPLAGRPGSAAIVVARALIALLIEELGNSNTTGLPQLVEEFAAPASSGIECRIFIPRADSTWAALISFCRPERAATKNTLARSTPLRSKHARARRALRMAAKSSRTRSTMAVLCCSA